jgi:S-formylglutathione hydrolase FrmB
VNVICCLLLGSILLNGYYHYYPTYDSLIGNNQSTQASLNKNGQVILQYNANGKPVAPNNSTLEGLLYPNNPQTTTNGRLYSVDIPGIISKFHTRDAWVYVPAIASTDPNALNLPVLVLLAGYPGAPTDWLNGVGLVNTMDAFAKLHHGITPIVVVADDTGSQLNDTECVNSPRGNVETYLTQDVPNYIEAHFPVSDSPSNWAIGGLSMGGSCAVMLALLHPNVYQTFLDMSGEIGPSLDSQAQTIQILFHGSYVDWQEHQPLYLLSHRKYSSNTGGFFASGNADTPTTIEQTKELYLAAKQDGLNTVYETVQGPHSFNVFAQIFTDAVPWLSNRVGATSCTGSGTCG